MAESLIYTDPNGNDFDLNLPDTYYSNHVDGRLMPPIIDITDEVPEQDGERYRDTRFGARLVNIPITTVGEGRSLVRSLLRSIAQSLNPKKGLGTLTLTTEDSLERYLTCKLIDCDIPDDGFPDIQRGVLVFKAYDPYWYASSAINTAFVLGEVTTLFFPIGPEVAISDAAIFAESSVTNTGDVEAWPVWTIDGPGTELIITNNTTGNTLHLTYNIGTTGQVVIDTRPTQTSDSGKTIVNEAGTNLFEYLSFASSFWSLEDGVNDLAIELTGATVDSSVQLSYRPRYVAA